MSSYRIGIEIEIEIDDERGGRGCGRGCEHAVEEYEYDYRSTGIEVLDSLIFGVFEVVPSPCSFG